MIADVSITNFYQSNLALTNREAVNFPAQKAKRKKGKTCL